MFSSTAGAAVEVRAFNQFQKSFQRQAVAPGMARRAQRTGRAHLRVPVDEMIFEIGAANPQGRLVGEGRFSLVFAPFKK